MPPESKFRWLIPLTTGVLLSLALLAVSAHVEGNDPIFLHVILPLNTPATVIFLLLVTVLGPASIAHPWLSLMLINFMFYSFLFYALWSACLWLRRRCVS